MAGVRAESPTPVRDGRTTSPYPGRLPEGDLLVFSKSNTTQKAHAVREFPDPYREVPKGAKKKVSSAQQVRDSLGDAIVVDSGDIMSGNGRNFLEVFADSGIKKLLSTTFGRDPEGEALRSSIEGTGVTVLARSYEGSTPSALDVEVDDDRIIFTGSSPDMPPVTREQLPKDNIGFIYLTSEGGENWDVTYDEIKALSVETDTPLGLSPGTAQIDSLTERTLRGEKKRRSLYGAINGAEVLLVNAEEAEGLVLNAPIDKLMDISKVVAEGVEEKHLKQVELLLRLKKLGAKMVSMTDGANGSYLIDDNNNVIHTPILETDGIVDKTGAGDTYAGGLLKSYMEGLSLEECMRRGAIYAHAAIQVEGVPAGLMENFPIEDKSKEYLDVLIPKAVYTEEYKPPTL